MDNKIRFEFKNSNVFGTFRYHLVKNDVTLSLCYMEDSKLQNSELSKERIIEQIQKIIPQRDSNKEDLYFDYDLPEGILQSLKSETFHLIVETDTHKLSFVPPFENMSYQQKEGDKFLIEKYNGGPKNGAQFHQPSKIEELREKTEQIIKKMHNFIKK